MAKGIWEEIKEQPAHIREIFMWVCVVAVFSVIGFSWFKSTSREFVALVNPKQAQQETQFAADQEKSQSPFATILFSWEGLKANISELFDFTKKTNNIQIENFNLPEIGPDLLPLSGNK